MDEDKALLQRTPAVLWVEVLQMGTLGLPDNTCHVTAGTRL